MNKKNLLVVLAGLMLASLILSACGSAAKSNFPTGKFIKSGETDYGLKFNADGTFEVFQGETTYVTSTYKVDGDVFTETSNDGGCETNVSFNYTFDGSKLTFSYVGDAAKDASCTGRYADFNNVTYTLAK
jgi:major membrane immunogen (membrane-anchored lipoprotein)